MYNTYIWNEISNESKEYLYDIGKSLKISNPVPKEELHITLIYSYGFIPNIDWLHNNTRIIKEVVYPVRLDWFGDKNNHLVVLVKSDYLVKKNRFLSCMYDTMGKYVDYTPHVTLGYDTNINISPDYILPKEPIHLISEHYRLIN